MIKTPKYKLVETIDNFEVYGLQEYFIKIDENNKHHTDYNENNHFESTLVMVSFISNNKLVTTPLFIDFEETDNDTRQYFN